MVFYLIIGLVFWKSTSVNYSNEQNVTVSIIEQEEAANTAEKTSTALHTDRPAVWIWWKSLSSLNAFHCAWTLLKHSKITHSGCCLLPCLKLEGLSSSAWCVTCTHFIKRPSAQFSFMSSCLLKPYAEAQRLYSNINRGRLQLGLDLPSGYFLGKTSWTFWLSHKDELLPRSDKMKQVSSLGGHRVNVLSQLYH